MARFITMLIVGTMCKLVTGAQMVTSCLSGLRIRRAAGINLEVANFLEQQAEQCDTDTTDQVCIHDSLLARLCMSDQEDLRLARLVALGFTEEMKLSTGTVTTLQEQGAKLALRWRERL